MRELAVTSLSFLGFALLHAAMPARRPSWAPKSPVIFFRIAALLVFVVAVIAGWEAGSLLGVLLMISSASMAATLFVLVTPIAPRLMWSLAALSGPLALALWLGGAHAG